MTGYEKEKQIERNVCIEMMREAFHTLRLAEQFHQINHNEIELASIKWKNLLDRIKSNGFYYVQNVRCVVPANFVSYIRDIEQIRLLILEEACKRKYQ